MLLLKYKLLFQHCIIMNVILYPSYVSRMVAFYAFSLSVIAYSYVRINKGLESTYLTRKAIVTDTFRVVIAYVIYMSIIAIFASAAASYVRKENSSARGSSQSDYDNKVATGLAQLVAYLVACRYVSAHVDR